MKSNRRPTELEEKLIEFLIQKASIVFPKNWKEGLLVSSMDDGNMGSLQILPQTAKGSRKFGKCVSEFIFKDVDGVDVVASLNVDENGDLLELDIWKVDFEPLIKLPNNILNI